MSVQVRRRREAAAFLQTFVGAQGELLVDTTNNRVQVHDGTTPGGFPAAAVRDLAGRNAGINTNFGINQRAYASGTALAAGAYGHDRHKAGAGGCTYTFTQAVADTTITVTAGTLVQAVDAPNVYAAAWWLTWTGTATARVWQGSASSTFSAGTPVTIDGVTVNALLVTGLTIGTTANVEFSTGTLGTMRPWQFEAALPNAGPTRLDRRHGEMALCQRYFQRFGATATSPYKKFGASFALSSGSVVAPLLNVAAMRAAPSLTYAGSFCLYGSGNTIFSVTSVGIDMADAQSVSAAFGTSGSLTIGAAYGIQAYGDPTARIDLSAEL